MARPEGVEPPTAWFVVFQPKRPILLYFNALYDLHCPIKLGYLASFAYIQGYLATSIGQQIARFF